MDSWDNDTIKELGERLHVIDEGNAKESLDTYLFKMPSTVPRDICLAEISALPKEKVVNYDW